MAFAVCVLLIMQFPCNQSANLRKVFRNLLSYHSWAHGSQGRLWWRVRTPFLEGWGHVQKSRISLDKAESHLIGCAGLQHSMQKHRGKVCQGCLLWRLLVRTHPVRAASL